jgi:AcrR family transcriptional regulator
VTNPATRTDGRLVRGERTRTAVLDEAVRLATESGLDGLSLGQLAQRLGVSKSGLFAHWRSKEDLQLATVERAREQWTGRIVKPALHQPRGVRRLWGLHAARLAFYESGTLPGGCFFAKADFEFAVREGQIRDLLTGALRDWLDLIERLAGEAVASGELRGVEPRQIAFEIDAAGVAAVFQSRLIDAPSTYRRARQAVLFRLRSACPDPTLLPEE